jgi:outer membrane protein
MEGLFMTGALRLCAASLAAAITATCAWAAEPVPVTPPPPEPPAPTFFVHLGALGIYTVDNASTTGGGFFNTIEPINPLGLPGPLATINNVTARPMYTLGYDLGYYITPNIALSLFSGVPPILTVKAEGLSVLPEVPGVNHGLLGTAQLGAERWGPITLLVQYHFTDFFGPMIQPYVGAGAAYIISLGELNNGLLRNFGVDQDWCLALQAGADLMLTPNWGVFAQVVKLFYETDAHGFLLNTNIPIRTRVVTDPWFPMVGLTFKY